jgi:hypothetical protein
MDIDMTVPPFPLSLCVLCSLIFVKHTFLDVINPRILGISFRHTGILQLVAYIRVMLGGGIMLLYNTVETGHRMRNKKTLF